MPLHLHEIAREIVGAPIPLGRVLRQAAIDDPLERKRDVGVETPLGLRMPGDCQDYERQTAQWLLTRLALLNTPA